MDILKYKGYEGTAELDMSRKVCRGKILFISDLVTYESDSPSSLQSAFEDAVEDYIETCEILCRKPQKPLSGVFNVRIPPSLHREASIRAISDDIPLNQIVVRALDMFVNASPIVHHNYITLTLSTKTESIKTLSFSPSLENQQWDVARVYG